MDAIDISQLDGLQQLRAYRDGLSPGPSIGPTLNFRLVAADEGRVVFEGTPTHQHMNPQGTVHGGWAAAILDSALACAVHSTCGAHELSTTLELKVNITRAILPDTGLFRCVGTLVHRGRRTGTSEARLEGPDGKLYAHATSTLMILPRT